MPQQYAPDVFDAVFAALSALPIVGGQAVNLWASRYSLHVSELNEFHPFLSKDADLFGDHQAVREAASPPGWCTTVYREPRQSAVALLTKELPGGEQLRVEIMRAVHGLEARDLRDATLVEVAPGRIYRLPSPIRLLKAKLANVRDLTKRERPQDLKHVRMLVPICAAYVRELHASVLARETPERVLINTVNELTALLRSPLAATVAAKHRLSLAPALPLDLPAAQLPKLAAFYAHLILAGGGRPRGRKR